MIHLLERFCRIVEQVAGLLLAACTILIVASTAGRYLFAWPIPDAFDISRLLVGACIMWGFASVGYRGGHIKVDLLYEVLPRRWRRVMDVFAWSMLLFFVVLLAWKMFGRVESAQRSHEATFDLQFRVWPMLALIWGGVAAAVVTIAARLYLIASGRGPLDEPELPELGGHE